VPHSLHLCAALCGAAKEGRGEAHLRHLGAARTTKRVAGYQQPLVGLGGWLPPSDPDPKRPVPPPPQPAQAAAEGTDIGRCRMLCVPAAEGLKCDAVGDLLTVFVVEVWGPPPLAIFSAADPQSGQTCRAEKVFFFFFFLSCNVQMQTASELNECTNQHDILCLKCSLANQAAYSLGTLPTVLAVPVAKHRTLSESLLGALFPVSHLSWFATCLLRPECDYPFPAPSCRQENLFQQPLT